MYGLFLCRAGGEGNYLLTMSPIHRLVTTTAPSVAIHAAVPRVMAHYGFTTDDIGSHPNALMTVEKFAITSVRPYVGECVYDSLRQPTKPIYRAIQDMCMEQEDETDEDETDEDETQEDEMDEDAYDSDDIWRAMVNEAHRDCTVASRELDTLRFDKCMDAVLVKYTFDQYSATLDVLNDMGEPRYHNTMKHPGYAARVQYVNGLKQATRVFTRENGSTQVFKRENGSTHTKWGISI